MNSEGNIFYSSNFSYSVFRKNYYKLLYLVFYYFIAFALLFSGTAKIIDSEPLINTLKLFSIFPVEIQILIAALLPIIEIGLAVFMLLKIKPRLTLLSITILFAVFLVFSIYGALAGIGGDCGCFGNVVTSSFGWGMIGRNIIFVIIPIGVLLRHSLTK